MKKLQYLIFALCAALFMSCTDDEGVYEGLSYKFNSSDKTAEVIHGKYMDFKEVVIPETVTHNGKTYRVTSIGKSAFTMCSNLTSISIPNSITNIGEYAFASAHHLNSIALPNGLTTIGDYAFLRCGIKSLDIPNSVTSIGHDAFFDCWRLTSVTLPNSITFMGEGAFSQCLVLPVIDNIAYADTYLSYVLDKKCTSVTIREGTKWIGTEAFKSCEHLTSITIPSSVVQVGMRAFFRCISLESITCLPTTPPSATDYLLHETDVSHTTLHVKPGCKEAYSKAEGWKGFGTIIDDATE